MAEDLLLGLQRDGIVVEGWQEFGLVGIALIVVLEVVKIVGSMARVKLNGKVEDPAIHELTAKLVAAIAGGFSSVEAAFEKYVLEDREAHRRIDLSLGRLEERTKNMGREP